MRQHIKFLMLLTALAIMPFYAQAACSNNEDGNPGQDGEIEYFSGDNMFRFCDDTSWIDMEYSVSATVCTDAGELYYDSANDVIVWCNGSNLVNAGEPNSAAATGCSGAPEGSLNYVSGDGLYYFCNGNALIPIPAAAGDTTPDAIVFADTASGYCTSGASVMTSAAEQVTGIDTSATVSITGGTAPNKEFQICSGTPCSGGNVVTIWGSADSTIDNNQYIALRSNTGINSGGAYTVEITIGTETFSWTINAGGAFPC